MAMQFSLIRTVILPVRFGFRRVEIKRKNRIIFISWKKILRNEASMDRRPHPTAQWGSANAKGEPGKSEYGCSPARIQKKSEETRGNGGDGGEILNNQSAQNCPAADSAASGTSASRSGSTRSGKTLTVDERFFVTGGMKKTGKRKKYPVLRREKEKEERGTARKARRTRKRSRNFRSTARRRAVLHFGSRGEACKRSREEKEWEGEKPARKAFRLRPNASLSPPPADGSLRGRQPAFNQRGNKKEWRDEIEIERRKSTRRKYVWSWKLPKRVELLAAKWPSPGKEGLKLLSRKRRRGKMH